MKTLFASTAATLLIAFGATLPVNSAQAETYYKCGSGEEFRLNSAKTGAHCYKPGNTVNHPINCPTVPVKTFAMPKNGKDVCEAKVNTGGNSKITQTLDPLPCNSGHSYKQNAVGNTDMCQKITAASVSKPDVAFTSTP